MKNGDYERVSGISRERHNAREYIREINRVIDNIERSFDGIENSVAIFLKPIEPREPKESIALVTNSRACGKFVALDNFLNHNLITYGKDASVVIKRARRMGYESPLVFYCPGKDEEGLIHC
jgi:hypothetical protein